MIEIKQELCVGCGKCAADCFPSQIEIADGKAKHSGYGCMECGHCVAVCPTGAISISGYDMNEVLEGKNIQTSIDPETFLNHLKFTRSIRQFKDTPVTEEQLQMIIDAGRFSATGGNLQNVAYYVSQKEVTRLKGMIIDELNTLGQYLLKQGGGNSWYSSFWLQMHNDYHEKNIDKLFFDAGTVIVVSSNSPQSAIIAAAHMETMVYSLGLGMLYSGFSNTAIENSPELRNYLQIPEGYHAYAVLVIGAPDVTYTRTVPRKPANIIRN